MVKHECEQNKQNLIPKADKSKFQPYLPERVLYILIDSEVCSTSFSLAKIETNDAVSSNVLNHNTRDRSGN